MDELSIVACMHVRYMLQLWWCNTLVCVSVFRVFVCLCVCNSKCTIAFVVQCMSNTLSLHGFFRSATKPRREKLVLEIW